MSDRWTDPRDLFFMSIRDLMDIWGVTTDELKREAAAGRLTLHGIKAGPVEYKGLRAYYPALHRWIARKWKMPARIRAKVEAAGGMGRLERFVQDQWDRCTLDWVANTMTLPDGEVLHDLRISRDDMLALWPVKH